MPYDGEDAAALARRFGAGDVVLLETTASVLDVAHELGARGASSGTLVLADEQTAGRGRHGRRWISPRGAGVWIAMLLRPHEAPAGGALAVRAGLAALDAALTAAPELAPRLKWPNDLMVADRKAGGVLCEARWSGELLAWVAVGIGINVKGPMPPGLGDAAIALDDVAVGLGRLAVLDALVPRLRALDRTGGALNASERTRFLDAAWCPPGATGTIADLTPDGALLVRLADGSLDRRTEPV